MDVAQWEKRLKENFTVNGKVGGNLSDIFEKENTCELYFATTVHGRHVLTDAFQGFFIETIENARQWLASNGSLPDCPTYGFIYTYYLVMFRRFRACEILLLKGYPFDGYALLRGLKDQAVVLACIAHNLTTLPKTWGLIDGQTRTDENFKQVTGRAIREEKRLLRLLLREDSGFPEGVIKELGTWERMFHEEVHGSRSSLGTDVMRWRLGKGEPSIGPTSPVLSEAAWLNYMYRAAEIGWLIVRLLPYLQPVENAFGEDWLRKHGVLDDSFRFSEESLSNIGREIGDAFIEFVDAKFSFKKPFYYSEADGSQLQIKG